MHTLVQPFCIGNKEYAFVGREGRLSQDMKEAAGKYCLGSWGPSTKDVCTERGEVGVIKEQKIIPTRGCHQAKKLKPRFGENLSQI